jgi:hypothetical protein
MAATVKTDADDDEIAEEADTDNTLAAASTASPAK